MGWVMVMRCMFNIGKFYPGTNIDNFDGGCRCEYFCFYKKVTIEWHPCQNIINKIGRIIFICINLIGMCGWECRQQELQMNKLE